MAEAGSFCYLLVILSVVFLLLPVSGLNQGLIEENLSIRYNLTFTYLPSTFGGPLGKGVDEYHVSVPSLNRQICCQPMDPAPSKDNLTDSQFWIVVTSDCDHKCLFPQVVRYAQTAGYDAAIIHNYESNRLKYMRGHHTDDILIPSIFIGHDDGQNIINQYFKAREHGQILLLSIELNGLEETNPHYYDKLAIFVPIAIVLTIMIIIFVVLVIRTKNDLIRLREQRNRPVELLPLSNSIATIPTLKLKCGNPYETCAICSEDYVKGDELRLLHCSHAYHCKCIDQWLNQKKNCPLCIESVVNQPTSVLQAV